MLAHAELSQRLRGEPTTNTSKLAVISTQKSNTSTEQSDFFRVVGLLEPVNCAAKSIQEQSYA